MPSRANTGACPDIPRATPEHGFAYGTRIFCNIVFVTAQLVGFTFALANSTTDCRRWARETPRAPTQGKATAGLVEKVYRDESLNQLGLAVSLPLASGIPNGADEDLSFVVEQRDGGPGATVR